MTTTPCLELIVSLQACRDKFQFLIAVCDDLQTRNSVIIQSDRQLENSSKIHLHLAETIAESMQAVSN